MSTVTLPQPPIFIQQGEYSARLTRNITSLLAKEGVVGDTLAGAGFAASERAAAPAMQVDVSAGRAFVDGDDIPNQGNYLVVSEDVVEVPVPPADTAEDRIDLVVLRVLDSDAGVVGDEAQVVLIEGTPDPSPTVPAVPDTAIALASVYVAANVIAILDADITDLRVLSQTALEAGARGSDGDQVFWENGQTVTASYTIREDFNAGTFGPVEISVGATVEIPVGSVWTVV
jgi:hypothetical protein